MVAVEVAHPEAAPSSPLSPFEEAVGAGQACSCAATRTEHGFVLVRPREAIQAEMAVGEVDDDHSLQSAEALVKHRATRSGAVAAGLLVAGMHADHKAIPVGVGQVVHDC